MILFIFISFIYKMSFYIYSFFCLSYILGWCFYSIHPFQFIKPLPALLLLNVPSMYLKLGFIFASFGDALLMLVRDTVNIYFYLGLLSFLITHIFIILHIVSHPILTFIHIATFFVLLLSISGYLLKFARLDIYTHILICVYSSVILLSWILSSVQFFTLFTLSSFYLFLGLTFFVLSDSLLSYNMFVQSIQYSSVWVISTYWISLYLIYMSQDLS